MIRQIFLALILCMAFGAVAADAATHEMTTDKRIVIPVTNYERNQVLFEMRAFLQGLFNIHTALADKDYKRVALSARALAPILNRVPSSMNDRLPVEFLELGNSLRESFNALAEDAEAHKAENVQGHLAETVAYCAGCHETFRFQVRAIPGHR